MKRLISLLLGATCCINGFAQEPVLSFNGELYFVPGSMTKGGEAFLVSYRSSDNCGYTIYDGDFNIADEQQTIVMSTMDGRVVRSLTAKQGSNAIS